MENLLTLDTNLISKIVKRLENCFDPEIAMDIVSLGLIYGIELQRLENNSFKVIITMSLTSPFCPMQESFVFDIKDNLVKIVEIKEVEVNFVFEPPWSMDMISLDAQIDFNL